MPDSGKCPNGADKHHTRNETDCQEEKEAKRRERVEEVNMALRTMLIIWDLVWTFIH